MKSIKYLSKDSCYIGNDVIFGDDIIIYPAVVLENNLKIGNKVIIQTGVIIQNNVEIGNNVEIQSGVVIKNNVKIGNNILIGINSLIRDNTTIKDGVIIGPNCEIKTSKISSNVRIGHKNFIGNSEIHEEVEIGFGTVTANYSQGKYSSTMIHEKTKIGCNVILIAPIKIGKNCLIAAGCVLKKDILDNSKVIQKKITNITKLK